MEYWLEGWSGDNAGVVGRVPNTLLVAISGAGGIVAQTPPEG